MKFFTVYLSSSYSLPLFSNIQIIFLSILFSNILKLRSFHVITDQISHRTQFFINVSRYTLSDIIPFGTRYGILVKSTSRCLCLCHSNSDQHRQKNSINNPAPTGTGFEAITCVGPKVVQTTESAHADERRAEFSRGN
jgi:hypothetical protein